MDRMKGLSEAISKEKDPKTRNRMMAVRMVLLFGHSAKHAAEVFSVTDRSVRNWADRFEDGGPEALRDLPKSGRPPSAPRDRVNRIISKLADMYTTPERLREELYNRTGVRFSLGHVRRLMRKHGVSSKVPTLVHVNRESRRAVMMWQRRAGKRISRLKRAGYTVLVQDEAFFVWDTVKGKKLWTWTHRRIFMQYTGSHQRIAVFGALAENGAQMFRSYKTANSDAFMDFVRQLKARFGKVAIIMDKAPWHASKKTTRMMREENVVQVFLPTGSPYLSAVEACWQRAKRHLLVAEHYPTFGRMKEAVSNFFKTTRFGLDIMKYLYRNPPAVENI